MKKHLALLLVIIMAVSVMGAADTVQAKNADVQFPGKLPTSTTLSCECHCAPIANQPYLLTGRVTTPQYFDKPVPYQWVRISILRYDAHKGWTPYPGQPPYVVTRTNREGYFAISRTSHKAEVICCSAMFLGYPDIPHSSWRTSVSPDLIQPVGPPLP